MTALIWHEPLRPEDVLQACRDAGVVLTYFVDLDAMLINGDPSYVACIIADVLRTKEQIKQFMAALNIIDSNGTPAMCNASEESACE